VADIRKILGENVRRARLAIGVSQEALADLAKIDRTYVSGVERGVRNPSVKILARLAKALKTTPEALLAARTRSTPVDST
jgi:transcriptional regulator with XRE-family HTH domain